MSTTQELLAANERYAVLRERVRTFAVTLAATDYRGPRPAEHFVADTLFDILDNS